jgi:alpha-mannosidase
MNESDAILARRRAQRLLGQRLPALIWADRVSARVSAWTSPNGAVPFGDVRHDSFIPIHPGENWGVPWSTTWLRIDLERPRNWQAGEWELLVELGFTPTQDGFQAEGLAYTSAGRVLKATSPRSHWVPVDELWDDAGRAVVFVEAAANPMILPRHDGEYAFLPTRLGDPSTLGTELQYTLGFIGLARHSVLAESLAHDIEVAMGVEQELPPTSPRRQELLAAVDDAVVLLNSGETVENVRQSLEFVLLQPAAATAHRVSAVGHAHIDSAWLWPFRETRRKVARTVANVLQLMDTYPEFTFAMSSAQQYAWLKEDHPELFVRLARRVNEGRFVPVGGMWVESDTTMPSGESVVRQFLEGRRYFHREFGLDRTDIVWLPDSFGFSGSLPQIMRLAGAERFLSQKLSWNDTNRFPHHTFWWEGIDGSRVYTHFPPVDTYHAELLPSELAHAERNFEENGRGRNSLVPYGYGDGGGGPTREMIERGRRMGNLEGSPRVSFSGPDAFFDAAESELPDPATWSGELYLEAHRGVFTSQARTKRGNRRVEALLHAAELWAAYLSASTGSPYPADELSALWRHLLLLHFHDVLPGSSISWVHQEAEAEFAALAAESSTLIRAALARLTGGDVVEVSGAVSDEGVSVANASPVPRNGVVSLAIGRQRASSSNLAARSLGDGTIELSNDLLRVLVASDGTIASLSDRANGRELAPGGSTLGTLRVHPDSPARWDAWDIDRADARPLGREIALSDPELRTGAGYVEVRTTGMDRASTFARVVRLESDASAVDILVDVDWQESDARLTIDFPLDVLAPSWSAETQFGHVRRPVPANTSWETAKFETCAHRWIHVEEPSFGVAIANDATYGYQVDRRRSPAGHPFTRVQASLLKASAFPDPQADRGAQSFRFSVRPSATVLDAISDGRRLCDPRYVIATGVELPPLVSVDAGEVLVETVKGAEDGSGDVILRLFEATGARRSVTLGFGLTVVSLHLASLYEVAEEELSPAASIDFAPFQVRTLRVRFETDSLDVNR